MSYLQHLILERYMRTKVRSLADMDVDAIRSRFIQENLRRALQAHDKDQAARALRAFRNYYQWFENQLPALEKLIIVSQLARLEAAYALESGPKGLSDPSPAIAR
jgi:hypothetical protein